MPESFKASKFPTTPFAQIAPAERDCEKKSGVKEAEVGDENQAHGTYGS
jgi:hypothetical protein